MILRWLICVLAAGVLAPWSIAQAEPVPKGAKLRSLVERYLEADEVERKKIREECDRTYAELEPGKKLLKLRKDLLKYASKVGPKISWKGTNYFYDKKKKRGEYISRGGGKSLWIGLHGGGEGSGECQSAASSMGGLGSRWIYPEVLEKTEHGWTTSGTEEFVVELIRAAKRSGKVDPDRIYITGHSMGGYGTWTLGAHHADLFAGAAAYAGAPTAYFEDDTRKKAVGIEDGVLPSYFHLPLFFFQSTDDVQVPPIANIRANQDLQRWKKEWPDGFNYRYVQVDDRGHAAPKKGYHPSQKWIMSHRRNARLEKFLWQPVLKWKKHHYWLYWDSPRKGSLVCAEKSGDNELRVHYPDDGGGPEDITVLCGEPLVDLSKEVSIKIGDEVRFKGRVKRTLSTLLLTLPRHDDRLLFDARVDIRPKNED